ncbi:MAG: hypothetical protein LBJ00_05245 [Planctomycetaceae bacterium]|jgi:hypothetical protein|nr:hypothetical protein [Planctomycetaceae bacterium]
MLLLYSFVKNFNLFLRIQTVIAAVFVVCCFQVELYGQIDSEFARDLKKYYGSIKGLKKEEYQKAIEFYRKELTDFTGALKFSPDNYGIGNKADDAKRNSRYSSPTALLALVYDIYSLCKISVEIIDDPVVSVEFRKYAVETLCIYSQSIESAIIRDEEYIKKIKEYLNEYYRLQHITFSGICKRDPSAKTEKPDKKEEEKLLKERLLVTKYGHEFYWHEAMTKFKPEFYSWCNGCIYILYSKSPADYKELEYILEKYKYPLDETLKIFAKLKIPFKNFRHWQSKDGFFRSNAKFIELKKDDVFLELTNGKRTEIELSALCKEDQDYVKKQLPPETKLPKGEKAKD